MLSSMTAIDAPEKKLQHERVRDHGATPPGPQMKPLFLSFEALPVAPPQLWVPKACKPKGVQKKSNELPAAYMTSFGTMWRCCALLEVKL
jgi:hypothetical protein